MKDIRIAAIIFHSLAYDIRQNLNSVEQWLKSAKKAGAAIACFPELNISGYAINERIAEAAEEIPGRITKKLAQMSSKYNIVILAGMAEKDKEGHIYASQLVVKPDGYVGVYRKLHIAPVEKKVFCAGDKIMMFETAEIKFGVQLCYDTHFPELSTSMAVMGADVIFMPHASPRGTPGEKVRSWLRHLPARAFDNSLFIVACNQCGENSAGLSFPGIGIIIDPSGKVIEKDTSGKEGMIVTDIKAKLIDRVRNHKMRYFLPNRRPEVY